MDYYSFDSEVIESLNILRPPVKRIPGNRNRDYSVYCSELNNNFQVFRGFGHNFTSKRTNPCKHEGSSTSLILKKTSESQILQKYSEVNYTSLHCQEQSPPKTKQNTVKDKPLIKVTVIPKTEKNSGSKLFRKQRVVTKTLQATSSNRENSIQTKNVYLVVAGRKKEKIYEIKTIGSEKFEKESIKDDAIENLSNFKQFIKTLNMERKRKKDKKQDSKNGRNETQVNVCKTKTQNEHLCMCSPPTEVEKHEVRPGKSKVRIFGRIGITEDDRYVLKCQATVDDTPIPTSLATAEKQMSSSSLADYSQNANFRNSICQRVGTMACVRESPNTRDDIIASLKDSIMQTDNRNTAANELLVNINNRKIISNESQSTQVNFNKTEHVPNSTKPLRTSEKATRCMCGLNDYPVTNAVTTANNVHDTQNLKQCQSPLVIISVFPKQDNINDFVKCAQEDTLPTFFENKTTVTGMTEDVNEEKETRSRSPSPKRANPKMKINKTIETRHAKISSRNESPIRSNFDKEDPKKGKTPPTQTMQFFNSNTKKSGTEKKITSPQRSPRARSPPPKGSQNKNTSRRSVKRKVKKDIGKVDVGVNTEHLQTKKALVDCYTNKLTEQMNGIVDNPAKSTVSFNIDSEKEYYDVSFRQDKFTTDVKVRKTMKEVSVQKSNEGDGSMDNLFPNVGTKPKRNSVYRRSICENHSNNYINKAPRLTVRDSLEIGHRREDKNLTITAINRHDSEHISINSNEMESLAPIKHFTGDNCTICDPVERDREIRGLLGVDGRRTRSQFQEPKTQVYAVGDQTSRQCLYPKQCEKTFITGYYLKNSKCQTNKCEAVHCDQCDPETTYGEDISDHSDSPQSNQKKYDNTSDNVKQRNRKQTDNKLNQTEETSKKKPSKKPSQKTKRKTKQPEKTDCMCVDVGQQCSITNCQKFNVIEYSDNPCPCDGESRQCPIPLCKKSDRKKPDLPRQIEDLKCSKEFCKKQIEMTKLASLECSIQNCKKFGFNKTESPEQHDEKTSKDVEQTTDKETKAKQSSAPKSNHEDLNLDKTSLYQHLTLNRNIQIFLQIEQFAKQKPIVLTQKQYKRIKKTIQHTLITKNKSKRCICERSAVSIGQKTGKKQNVVSTHREVQTDTRKSEGRDKDSKKSKRSRNKNEPDTIVLFSNETRGSAKDKKPVKVVVKRAASSMEIRNTNVAYWKHVTFSSTNMGSVGSSSFAQKNQNSMETLFRGHKKCFTPNLGTSAFSLISEARISESQSMNVDAKTKRPFLKRLMSCLVMRSKGEKIPGRVDPPSVNNSSVDSYHISTSLEAIEMTSSIYDTSVSFYSDHSIHPLSSKLKRNFFNSVREFLTSRKS